jgi:hypothetical protein
MANFPLFFVIYAILLVSLYGFADRVHPWLKLSVFAPSLFNSIRENLSRMRDSRSQTHRFFRCFGYNEWNGLNQHVPARYSHRDGSPFANGRVRCVLGRRLRARTVGVRRKLGDIRPMLVPFNLN